MQSDHIQFFYELSPFRPEWVAYVPRIVWVLGQILGSSLSILTMLKHKEYEHISLPLGPFAFVLWLNHSNRIVGPITAYTLVTWFVYSFAGFILSAILLDGLSIASHPSIEARPIATFATWVILALLYKNLKLKEHIYSEAKLTVEETHIPEIPYDAIGFLFSQMKEKSRRRDR